MNTGEFARFCGTNKRTLFLYDQMGLLKPVEIHANGYREYMSSQIGTMDMIKILQASGYTLRQINEMIHGTITRRRNCFFDARASIDARIAELVSMRTYITKKEQLFQEYQEFQQSSAQFKIIHCDMTYTEKQVSGEHHFFGFLQDGDYDAFIMDDRHHMSVFKECDHGVHKEGCAISFFIEIPSESQDIVEIIQRRLHDFQFHGERKYYMRSLPHLLIEEEGVAIIKVVVFEEG